MSGLPSYEQHLLPQNATALEQVLAAVAQRVQDIPVPIDRLKRPLDVPSGFLPPLAWELSVDVWKRGWSQTRQRAVTDASIRLHQRKGTVYALSEYIRYADGRVRGILRPPMKVFSGPSLTREERERWLSGLPQLRVWRIRDKGRFSRFKGYSGGRNHSLFFERRYATPSVAIERLRRRARWVVGDTETDVRVTEFGSYYRLHLRSAAGKRTFSDRPARPLRYLVPSEAWRRIVTIQPTPRLAWRIPRGPSLRPVTSEPELVKVCGTRGRSVFCDTPLSGFLVPTTAPLRIYHRFAVHDGRRVLRRPSVQIMGTGRYGFPVHTAHVHVSIPGKRSRWAAGTGIVPPRSRFWLPHDPRRLIEARLAAQSAKRLSDRVLFKIGPERRFVAGRPFIAGYDTFIVGRP